METDIRRVFRWSDGYVPTWVNWGSQQPDNINEHCVVRGGDAGIWGDRPCNLAFEFYCEGEKILPKLRILILFE